MIITKAIRLAAFHAVPLVWGVLPASAQTSQYAYVVTTCGTLPAAYTASTVAKPQYGAIVVDINGNLCGGTTIAGGTVATTQGTTPWLTRETSQYPNGAIAETASATGTTAATTATLATNTTTTTFICGFSIRANATAAATGNSTVTGTVTGTLNFTQWTAPAATGIGLTEMTFSPCVPASAVNTAIAVISAAPGTGGVVSVTAWGYQL